MRRRIVWLAVAAMFAVCAAAPYGGGARIAWIGVYGTAALLAAGSAFGFVLWRAAAVLAIVAGGWSTAVFPRGRTAADWLGREGRESLGLALVAIAMLAICWDRLRSARDARAKGEGEGRGAGTADAQPAGRSFADLASGRAGARRGERGGRRDAADRE
jgi:hypothetical protein